MTKSSFVRFGLALSSFALIGGGCLFGAETETTVDGEGEGEEAVELTSPPAVHLFSEGEEVAGVEGSYCYGPMCVDKIAPPDLIAEAGIEAEVINTTMLTVAVDAGVETLSVSVSSAAGADVACATSVSEGELAHDATIFTVTMCDLPVGEYIVNTFVTFAAGGDVSYFFPVKVE